MENNKTLTTNTFTNNEIAIGLYHDGNSQQSTSYYPVDLKCNTFNHETVLQTARKGLVIGQNVVVQSYKPHMDGNNLINYYDHRIGGDGSFSDGIYYPNANVWPTPDFDEVIPNSGLPNFIPLDVNDVWGNSPNWISIQNASSNAVTYHRFFNEFVGKSIALVNTELAPVTYTDESVVTQANSNVNPNLTTVPACSLLVDPTPILFPSRIAVVGLDSTTTSVIHSKIGKGLEISDPIPNPASGKVLILASIPFKYEQATLQILQSGTSKVLQNIKLANGAKLEITLDVEKSPTGAYQYRLIVDGKASKPKALIVTH